MIIVSYTNADSFFVSCEIALNPKLQGHEVWVGGGRRAMEFIAANRHAKKFGVITGEELH
jgi:nucleotidyltransferase/DNA polymerase involved in DNA repair